MFAVRLITMFLAGVCLLTAGCSGRKAPVKIEKTVTSGYGTGRHLMESAAAGIFAYAEAFTLSDTNVLSPLGHQRPASEWFSERPDIIAIERGLQGRMAGSLTRYESFLNERSRLQEDVMKKILLSASAPGLQEISDRYAGLSASDRLAARQDFALEFRRALTRISILETIIANPLIPEHERFADELEETKRQLADIQRRLSQRLIEVDSKYEELESKDRSSVKADIERSIDKVRAKSKTAAAAAAAKKRQESQLIVADIIRHFRTANQTSAAKMKADFSGAMSLPSRPYTQFAEYSAAIRRDMNADRRLALELARETAPAGAGRESASIERRALRLISGNP